MDSESVRVRGDVRKGAEMEADIKPQVALKSKRQGDAVDYRVLAQSEGPLSNKDFESLFNRLSVGNLPTPAQSKYEGERPPWVTFGTFKLDGATYIAAIHQDWTARNDRSTRQVSATVGLCLPYEVFAAEAPSYRLLHNQMPGVSALAHTHSGTLETPRVCLTGEGGQWEAVAKSIEEFGVEFCASVAALAVQSPVALVNGYDLSSDLRLSFIDAVAGLLPFGARADLSASTWMQSASSSAMRLGFTDQARPGQQQRVAWGEAASNKLERGSKAERYYQLLLDIKDRCGLAHLVTALSGRREPMSFGEGDAFIDALRETDLLNLLWQDLKAGRASSEEIRRAFELNGISNLPEEKQRDLLAVLVEDLEARDLELLSSRWLDGLQSPVCEAISHRLQVPNFQSDILWGLYRLADEKNWLARYLEALMEPMPEPAEPRPEAVRLLYQGILQLARVAPRPESQRIWEQLARHRRMLYELALVAIYEAQDERAVKNWLTWLAGDSPVLKEEFDVFLAAAGLKKKAVTSEQLDAIGRVPGNFVRLVVGVAINVSRASKDVNILERFVNAVSAWLLTNLGGMDDVERQRWRQLLPALKDVPTNSDYVDARWDVIYLSEMSSDRGLLLEPYLF